MLIEVVVTSKIAPHIGGRPNTFYAYNEVIIAMPPTMAHVNNFANRLYRLHMQI